MTATRRPFGRLPLPMLTVQALLRDQTVEARFPIWPRLPGGYIFATAPYGNALEATGGGAWHKAVHTEVRVCPLGRAGDRRLIAERLVRRDFPEPLACYEAGHDRATVNGAPVAWRWKRRRLPAHLMPRSIARLAVEVTSCRAERLQDITEAGAAAAGIAHFEMTRQVDDRRAAFAVYWDFATDRMGQFWRDNPWIWVLGLRAIPLADLEVPAA